LISGSREVRTEDVPGRGAMCDTSAIPMFGYQ